MKRSIVIHAEKGVPIPPQKRRGPAARYPALEPGDSFVYPLPEGATSEEKSYLEHRLRYIYRHFRGQRTAVRRIAEGVRIWCVEGTSPAIKVAANAFPVERGIQMPARRCGPAPVYPPLEIGESFLLAGETRRTAWIRLHYLSRKYKKRDQQVVTRTVPEGIRVWRTA